MNNVEMVSALGEMKECVVVGWDNDDGFYFTSSIADGAEVLWLLEIAKKELLENGYNE